MVYPPYQLEEGRQYPIILYVYGGPEFQVIYSLCIIYSYLCLLVDGEE